ncbi:MAG: class I SAM-dependent methyltransferase [Planctomycetaceae bacterium]|nr:class I SAM-dependent methyltransferase [Planctomycetaceae bacterium]
MTNPNTAIPPESFEMHVSDRIHEKLNGVIEMSRQEQRFLNGLIRQFRPRKILEIGVSAGGSSALILNAIQDVPEAHLYSVDFSNTYYRDRNKKCGFYVEENFPEFLARWTLKTGKLAAEYMDEFGCEFDFCFIDTAHCLPGEILDYLMVLPYLKNHAFVTLHDLSLYTLDFNDGYKHDCDIAPSLLFSLVNEPKWQIDSGYVFPNMGAFRVDHGKASPYIDDLFRILTLPWAYIPDRKDHQTLIDHFSRHYHKDQVELFQKIYSHQYDQFYNKKPVKNRHGKDLTIVKKIFREFKRPFRQMNDLIFR